MKIHTYAWGLALMMAIPTWAMQNLMGSCPQPPDDIPPVLPTLTTIYCSRLTQQEHQKLAEGSDVCLMKKNLSDGDVKMLLPLLQVNLSLTKLDLFRNNIGANGAKVLASLPNLQHLNLEENKVGDEGAAAFEANTNLETLNLFKNNITDLGAIPLARNTTLQELGLYSNQVTDLGAFALAANRGLRKLDLRRNQVTDKGAQALALNQTLQTVFLGRNAITDEGAKAFINRDNFTHVDLKDTKVSDEAVKLFEQAFPHNGFLIRFRHLIQPRLGLPSLASSLLPLAGDTVCLLSIDGGGIRGLIPALVLQRLEEKLARKLGRAVALTEGFDWMSGTSTGGLIALGLNIPGEADPTQPKYPASQLVKLYRDCGSAIFPKTWSLGLVKATYNPQPLEKLLGQYFGEVYLSEVIGNVLVTAFNMGEDATYLFNSLKAKNNPNKDFLVRHAARATSAAPTYFPAAQVANRRGKTYSFTDGGVYANNPTAIGIGRMQKLYPHAKRIVVLSLGTGEGLPDRSMDRLNNAGKLGWAAQIASHLMDNAAEVAGQTIKAQARQDPRLVYIRIQAALKDSETGMDNASTPNIQALMNAAETTIRNHKKEMKQIAAILIGKLAAAQPATP